MFTNGARSVRRQASMQTLDIHQDLYPPPPPLPLQRLSDLFPAHAQSPPQRSKSTSAVVSATSSKRTLTSQADALDPFRDF